MPAIWSCQPRFSQPVSHKTARFNCYKWRELRITQFYDSHWIMAEKVLHIALLPKNLTFIIPENAVFPTLGLVSRTRIDWESFFLCSIYLEYNLDASQMMSIFKFIWTWMFLDCRRIWIKFLFAEKERKKLKNFFQELSLFMNFCSILKLFRPRDTRIRCC